ncbi:hypothetical protein IFM89_016558 [Coptis chinensis]|uniref:RNase H type-1 domain-containing protein n=1 Tax=Coptis chinensis TaxID=261450 RepID=A0A835IAI5_9MAGN|nr:hypothetical protein IFM89_016558 [Coptis chinensis]
MVPTTPQMSLGLKSSHLLELLRNSLLPSNTALTAIEDSNQHAVKPCAMTLRQFGIKFKKDEDDNLCSMKLNMKIQGASWEEWNRRLGVATNYQAEVLGIIESIDIALQKGWRTLWVVSDSEQAVRAFNSNKTP